jgi:hypothetical protein
VRRIRPDLAVSLVLETGRPWLDQPIGHIDVRDLLVALDR